VPAARSFHLLDGAKSDLRSAVRWYDERVQGAGDLLVAAIDDAIGKVVEAPLRWPVLEGEYRRHVMKKYPYSIVYRLRADEIFVVAVAHHARQPDYWRRR